MDDQTAYCLTDLPVELIELIIFESGLCYSDVENVKLCSISLHNIVTSNDDLWKTRFIQRYGIKMILLASEYYLTPLTNTNLKLILIYLEKQFIISVYAYISVKLIRRQFIFHDFGRL